LIIRKNHHRYHGSARILSYENDKTLRKAGSLGRRLTANGLTAYWAFQGWGNDPDAFDDTFIKTLEAHFADQRATTPALAKAAEKNLHERYWGYTVPGTPALIALDTRTSRAFAKGDGPRLLSPKAFVWLKDQLDAFGKLSKWVKGTDTIVDADYWSASKATYRAFLRSLATVTFTDNIIFLSGDVHYTYAAIEPKMEAMVAGVAPTLIQLTSSSTCNRPSDTDGQR
jgi:hypothetical protein